jgi:hypothetical protein
VNVTGAEKKKMNLKDKIKQELRTIPNAVMTGGVMTTTLWKSKAEKANKLLSQPRASETELSRVLDELRSFK